MHDYDYATSAFAHQDLLCVAPAYIYTAACVLLEWQANRIRVMA